jgi:polysaccharide export outer membrane protein
MNILEKCLSWGMFASKIRPDRGGRRSSSHRNEARNKERSLRRTDDTVMTFIPARTIVPLVVASFLLLSAGCNSLADPSEVTRGYHGDRLVVPILDNVDPIDEPDIEFQGATDVRPADLRAEAMDYVVGPNDLVSVSIFDLLQRDVESIRTARVSQTGLLQLPLLPQPVKAAGLTEAQLQRAIADAYREAGLMDQAQVTVTVIDARQRTFNITGAVMRPGQYVIIETDFRLLQALVQAGDTTFPAEYAYILRKRQQEMPAEQQGTEPVPQAPVTPATQPADLAPRSEASIHAPILATIQEPGQPAGTQPAPAGEGRFIYIDGKPVFVPAGQPGAADTTPAPQPADDEPQTRIQAQPNGQPGVATEDGQQEQPFEFGAGTDYIEETRVIRIPLQELKNGDLRYNVIVRPDDMIIVPMPVQGEYYMSGHVGAPGAYALTGRKITLKQAVTAARMLDPFAVPWRTDLVRRIGTDREIYVRVNLQQIFVGKQPDIYLKPNDVVMVGTDWYPPFLLALRGAFRATYGFGFIYDRNYAKPQPTRFETD